LRYTNTSLINSSQCSALHGSLLGQGSQINEMFSESNHSRLF